MIPDFVSFQKLPRLFRECVITEKLDGSNSQIFIGVKGSEIWGEIVLAQNETHYMLAGSRNRWIFPESTHGKGSDNYGFAQWALENCQELFKLGEGRHFGEWWGKTIQRNYRLSEKRFSLFNTDRWCQWSFNGWTPGVIDRRTWVHGPSCCHVVPILYSGPFSTDAVTSCINSLNSGGSAAAPEFESPEGVVVWHVAANRGFKVTCKDDASHKGVKGD